jgi:CheY-like chemotaxis protein
MIEAIDGRGAIATLPPLTPTVLLVEDEPLVAMLTEENLRDLGFEPFWVATAAEALHALEHQGLRPALAIIDVGLPDMRGDNLAELIRRLRPDLGIILASGYDEADLRARFAGEPRISVLAKPYGGGDLERCARALASA